MTATAFQTHAQAIAYVLGEPPERVDWATALVYTDPEETRYQERTDEADARGDAERTNLAAMVRTPSGSLPVRAYAVYQEVRKLTDGTQIINPWTEAEGK